MKLSKRLLFLIHGIPSIPSSLAAHHGRDKRVTKAKQLRHLLVITPSLLTPKRDYSWKEQVALDEFMGLLCSIDAIKSLMRSITHSARPIRIDEMEVMSSGCYDNIMCA